MARWQVLLHGAHHCARGNNHRDETKFHFDNTSGETSSIYPASTDVWRLDDLTFGGYKKRFVSVVNTVIMIGFWTFLVDGCCCDRATDKVFVLMDCVSMKNRVNHQ